MCFSLLPDPDSSTLKMCTIHATYWRCCKGIYSRRMEHCKNRHDCNELSNSYRYLSHRCPACEADDEKLRRQKREKMITETVTKEDSSSRIVPATQTAPLASHAEEFPTNGTYHLRLFCSIRPDTVTLETYSPPSSPKCVPMCDADGEMTSVVPETPAAFEQLLALVHPKWDGISQRRKDLDAKKARKAREAALGETY